MVNVYVVSDCEYREGATVIGAAVEWDRAAWIADRPRGEGHDRVVGWSPWKEEVNAAEGSCWWLRDGLLADGTIHPSWYQEIVVVPLDGLD